METVIGAMKPRVVDELVFQPHEGTATTFRHWELDCGMTRISVRPPHWDEDWEPDIGAWFVTLRAPRDTVLMQHRFDGPEAEANAFTFAALLTAVVRT